MGVCSGSGQWPLHVRCRRKTFIWYVEVRVRYRRKKFAFAVSSPDEFLSVFVIIAQL